MKTIKEKGAAVQTARGKAGQQRQSIKQQRQGTKPQRPRTKRRMTYTVIDSRLRKTKDTMTSRLDCEYALVREVMVMLTDDFKAAVWLNLKKPSKASKWLVNYTYRKIMGHPFARCSNVDFVGALKAIYDEMRYIHYHGGTINAHGAYGLLLGAVYTDWRTLTGDAITALSKRAGLCLTAKRITQYGLLLATYPERIATEDAKKMLDVAMRDLMGGE